MQKLPKIVRNRLEIAREGVHPDANLLTAFAEKSLRGIERDRVMTHLARCADCREAVALALPAIEANEAAVAPSARGWFTWPGLRWGVAAAGVLAVISVGVLQYRQRHQEKTLVASRLFSPQQLTAAQDSPAARSEATQKTSAATLPAVEMSKSVTGGKKQVPPPQVLIPQTPIPSARGLFPRPQVSRQNGTGTGAGIGSGAGMSTSRTFESGTRAFEAARATPQVSPSASVLNQQIETVGKAKPAEKDAYATGLAPAPPLHTDPNLMKRPAAHWTISASGALQRSFDGGQTWQDVNVPASDSNHPKQVQSVNSMTVEVSGAAAVAEAEPPVEAQVREAQPEAKSAAKSALVTRKVPSAAAANAPAATIFRAVSASSDAEVWAGGSGGRLYHSIDGGNRWTRVVPSDSGAALTGDVVSIQFSDTQTGIVTTSVPEVWSTSDGGVTWQKRP